MYKDPEFQREFMRKYQARRRAARQPHPRPHTRSSRRSEDRENRLEWRRLQRSLAKIEIESPEEELARLIQEQARDDRTIQIKYDSGLKGFVDEVYSPV
jgi:hypothetical protein